MQVTSVQNFVRRPESSAVLGNGWLFYCFDAGLVGLAAWGVPTMEDYHLLEPCLDRVLDKAMPPHVSILDIRKLGRLGNDVFVALARYGEKQHDAAKQKVRRQIVLPPVGYTRALLVGWRELVKPPYEVVFVDSEDEAARAADRPDAVALFASLASLIETPLSAQVARVLDEGPADIGSVARKLAVAPRTLQRRLAAEGTSFAQLSRRTMVERAKELLANTEDKLEVIARRVGYPSASHFTTSFRRATGMTPSAWRALGKPDA